MELYFKNKNGQLQETTLEDILVKAFSEAKFKMDNGSFVGDNHRWVGVVQKCKKEDKSESQVLTNITFMNDKNTITGLHVYETPIIKVVDDENSRQIV